MSDKRKCIAWTQPGSSLTFKVVKLLEELGCEVDHRSVDGANWTWTQFKAASPEWSNLPAIQTEDGRILRNIKEVEAEFGKPESIYNPEVKPWAPR